MKQACKAPRDREQQGGDRQRAQPKLGNKHAEHKALDLFAANARQVSRTAGKRQVGNQEAQGESQN
eukprot:1143740-Pelagomonas_calceolata.AAC.1